MSTVHESCMYLEIPYGEKNNMKLIKGQYFRLSLKHHPDKNNNSVESNEQFKQINNSYRMLVDYNDSSMDVNATEYDSLFTSWVSTFTTAKFADGIIGVLKNIDTVFSFKIFSALNKEQAFEVYQFISKHQSILRVSDEQLENMCKIIRTNFENDEVIIIHPTMEDILENKIYKLTIWGKMYAVPSWHDELQFDMDNNRTLTVICTPELPSNITIDEYKNVYITHELPFLFDYLERESVIHIPISDTHMDIDIPCTSLSLQMEQIVTVKGHGISIPCGKDMYSTNKKGNMYVKIRFV